MKTQTKTVSGEVLCLACVVLKSKAHFCLEELVLLHEGVDPVEARPMSFTQTFPPGVSQKASADLDLKHI